MRRASHSPYRSSTRSTHVLRRIPRGRIPLLTHEKALVIQTTTFDKASYDAGLRDAIRVLVDEFAIQYPGIKHVEREYFYAVHDDDRDKLCRYLERAHQLGRDFWPSE